MIGMRWRHTLAGLTLVLGASCSGSEEAGVSASTGDSTAPSEEGPVWLFPPDGYEMTRERLRLVVGLPPIVDLRTVSLHLNGTDQTERLSTINGFRPKQLQTILSLFHPDSNPNTLSTLIEGSRLICELPPATLTPGWNELVLSYRHGSGSSHETSRRFRVRESGREIRMTVRRRTGTGLAKTSARIVFEPIDGAPPVDFSLVGSQTGRMSTKGRSPRTFVLARNGEVTVWLPPGRYRAVATVSSLDSLDEWLIPREGPAEHQFEITREVELTSTATVDLHVHSALSNDSYLSQEGRVWSFLAAGVDIIVASDHRIIADYRPVLRALGSAAEDIRVISGIEADLKRAGGTRLGHWNAWPLAPPVHETTRPAVIQRTEFRRLIPPPRTFADVQTSPAALFDVIRKWSRENPPVGSSDSTAAEPTMIQLNHPRGVHFHPAVPVIRSHDWFNQCHFDPEEPLDSPKNRLLVAESPGGTTSLDFDALEIWNRHSRHLYLEVRRDWFSLLNQGLVRTATANTDTHGLSLELPGYPMNIVFLPPGVADGPRVTPRDLNDAIRSGRVVGTDGPVPLLTISSGSGSARPGDLLAADGGEIEVLVEVRAASWVPVGPVTVWVNGTRAAQGEVEPDREGRARGIFEVALNLDRDAWILVEVGHLDAADDGTSLPGDYGLVAPFGFAFGFTNPVLVDVDGNGRFDPPGLAQ